MQITIDEHERQKDFITESEHDRLLKAAGQTRYPERNQLLVMMLYRHGIRETEAVNIRIHDIQLNSARIWQKRIKGSAGGFASVVGGSVRVLGAVAAGSTVFAATAGGVREAVDGFSCGFGRLTASISAVTTDPGGSAGGVAPASID